MAGRLKRFRLNAFIHNCISGYLNKKNSLFGIRWVSPYNLEQYRAGRKKHIIPVLNNPEDDLRQVLLAFSHYLYLYYRQKFWKISEVHCKALEMALLRGLACSMGIDGVEIFRSGYLPGIVDKPDIHQLYLQLTDLDDRGLLMNILLPELENLPLSSLESNEEVTGLIHFLTYATRDCYFSPHIRIGVYQNDGELPDEECRICSDRFYLIDSLSLNGTVRCLSTAISSEKRKEFEQRVSQQKLKPGHYVNCRVVKQQQGVVILDIDGLKGVLYKEDWSWNLMEPLPEFQAGGVYSLALKEIDRKRGRLILSHKTQILDPRNMPGFPELYTLITVEVVRKYHTFLLGKLDNRFEVLIPFTELQKNKDPDPENLIGSRLKVMIYRIDENGRIYGSRKKSESGESDLKIPSALV